MNPSEQVNILAQNIRRYLPKNAAPKVGIVLGTGWSPYGDTFQGAIKMSYSEIGFPSTEVIGHTNALVYGRKFGVETLIMQGRVHYYEGFDLQTVVAPIRTLIACGCKILILTNAAGGMKGGMFAGQLVVITDHINVFGQSPLRGANDPTLGVRFPDMTSIYDKELQEIALMVGQKHNLHLGHGIYAGVLGPQYETPAEIQMLTKMGADLVGMSTVPEAIAARHMGARILGISCVSNIAAGLSGETLSHEEVTDTAARIQTDYVTLLDGFLQACAKQINLAGPVTHG